MMILTGAILLVLCTITYHDFMYRAVYWICFPLLALLFSVYKIKAVGFAGLFTDMMFTGGFLLVQLLVLWLYFYIKYRKSVNLTDGYLGWGDILFLLAVCFYLSPVNYIMFYVVSLIVSISYALIARSLVKNREQTIPLAGIQALLFVFLLIAEKLMQLNFYQDTNITYNLLPN